MAELRIRLLILTDRVLGALLAGAAVGTTLAFGGAAWWARPALAVLVLGTVLAWLFRILLEGTWRVPRSPLVPLGLLILALGVVQLAPLPSVLAGRISPRSRSWHLLGAPAELIATDDPSTEPLGSGGGRTPATVDRSATLQWLAGAAACLALFVVAAQFADRLGHLMVLWGGVVAALAINTILGWVQLLGQVPGLFGFIQPGQGLSWGPSLKDLVTTPNVTALRLIQGPSGASWAVEVPDRSELIGTMMGGPGAYLALAALGLPLTLGLTLQVMAPRGSREGLWARLGHSGQGSLVVLLACLILAGSLLGGLLAGPVLALPLALGLALAGLPAIRGTGLRWVAFGMTVLALAGLGGGVVLGNVWDRPEGDSPLLGRGDWAATRAVWTDAIRMARDFPVLGSGLGTFAAVEPFYKTRDQATTTALSSLLQFWSESGAVGLVLLGLAGLWSLARLPGALRRVGSADRALAFGLLGSAVGFALFSVLHWSVQLAAIAVAASLVGGTWDRWLAGGTDLFVERG